VKTTHGKTSIPMACNFFAISFIDKTAAAERLRKGLIVKRNDMESTAPFAPQMEIIGSSRTSFTPRSLKWQLLTQTRKGTCNITGNLARAVFRKTHHIRPINN
jgi:hypothetical protein